ncbi:MAG: efflux RND transporter periplasmic adaptor subunit [Phycisphaerales bacterium JB052]
MRKTLRNTILISTALLLSGGVLVAMAADTQSTKITTNMATYTVERAPLSITLTESGTVKSRDQYIVKNEVEGRTSIIYVIDEGTLVSKGDLLIELDSSALEDRLVDQQIQVENSEADYVSAKENLEVVKIQTQSNVARAELDNQFAIEDKVKYLEGEWPKQLMEAETDVTLKDEELRRTTDEFNWSKRLFEEKYLSETEYRADELAMKRAQLQLALSQENLKLLKNFTHKRRIAELDSEIEQMALTLERVRRESSSDLVQAEARLRAREAELKRQQGRLDKIEDQIAKTKMYAPADGMVVYATSSEFSWRGDTEPLDEGQEVRERQELIHLPTADSMMVRMQIHESSLGKVSVGQPVNIKIDALPESSFTGRVTKIAPLPDAQSVFMNPDLKVYDTDVMIDGVHQQLRTGMSCQATILIEKHLDAIAVPLQSVVGRGSDSMVYVIEGNKGIPRKVTTGLDNNAMIHIIDGLKAGEKIMLTPPLSENVSMANASKGGEFPNQGATQRQGGNTQPPTATQRPTGTRPPQGQSGARPQRGGGGQP